eukprot:gnl/Trimastix_PCT/3207.p1 GENE.gnl/Trimastix_PCT/3207~~gnl/Trimastix_PCT/3207.p1  ORF type:complete len:174 (-),score=22.68 gnl/Trimastix_PCT/3207:40-561(-)
MSASTLQEPVVVCAPSYLRAKRPPPERKEKPSKMERLDQKGRDRSDEVFVSTRRVVEELGGQYLTGKERREWVARQLKIRGGIAAPNLKVPFPIMQGIRRAKERREKNERDRQQKMGYRLQAKKKDVKKLREKDRKRIRGMKTSGGHFHDGTLHVSKKMIRDVQNSGKKGRRR